MLFLSLPQLPCFMHLLNRSAAIVREMFFSSLGPSSVWGWDPGLHASFSEAREREAM